MDDYDDGLPTKEIAKKYEISETRVEKLCREYEKYATLVEALVQAGKEHPEWRPNIIEKLHDLGVIPDKARPKTQL